MPRTNAIGLWPSSSWSRFPMPNQPNPMRELLRQEMGIDAFDGDDTVLLEAWSERPRPKERGKIQRASVLGLKAP